MGCLLKLERVGWARISGLFGHWLLVIGYWSLVIGHWSLAK